MCVRLWCCRFHLTISRPSSSSRFWNKLWLLYNHRFHVPSFQHFFIFLKPFPVLKVPHRLNPSEYNNITRDLCSYFPLNIYGFRHGCVSEIGVSELNRIAPTWSEHTLGYTIYTTLYVLQPTQISREKPINKQRNERPNEVPTTMTMSSRKRRNKRKTTDTFYIKIMTLFVVLLKLLWRTTKKDKNDVFTTR